MYKIPSKKTLDKYGLSEEEWISILEKQNFRCPICEKEPSSGIFRTDHYHVPKWKSMPPEQRKKYIRGLLCFFCNRYYVGRSITIQKAENVVKYLSAFAEKFPFE
jgi:transcription elongation factor Elf1